MSSDYVSTRKWVDDKFLGVELKKTIENKWNCASYACRVSTEKYWGTADMFQH